MAEQQKIEHGIGAWQPKAWGFTRTIYRDAAIEIVECDIKKGGYSSNHLHRNKHNEFRVLSGRLRIEYDSSHSPRILVSGCTLEIPAGFSHRFLALEDTRLIEIYTPILASTPIDPDDIERFTTGGRNG